MRHQVSWPSTVGLLRRQRHWVGFTGLVTAIFGAMAVVSDYMSVPPNKPSREAFRVSMGWGLEVGMAFLVLLILGLQSQRRRYEAALPIAAIDLWLSRLIPLLALVWLPPLAAISGGLPPWPLVTGAAIYTVLVFATTGYQMSEYRLPKWVSVAGLRIGLFAFLVGPWLVRNFHLARLSARPSSGIVLTLGVVIGAAAVFRIRARSSPLVRSVWGQAMLIVILFLVADILFGQLWIAGFVVGSSQVHILGRCRWLLALPVSTRRLFVWVTIPTTLAIIGACIAASLFVGSHSLSGKGRWVEAALELSFLYAMILLSELPAWRPLSRLRAIRFGVWIVWAPFVIGALLPLFVLPDTRAVQRFADQLPASIWQLTSVLTLPVLATWLLAAKLFGELEYRPGWIDAAAYSRERA